MKPTVTERDRTWFDRRGVKHVSPTEREAIVGCFREVVAAVREAVERESDPDELRGDLLAVVDLGPFPEGWRREVDGEEGR